MAGSSFPREPKLAGALGGGGLELKIGWLFNGSRTHASVGVLAFSLGGVSFPTQGPERPSWLSGFLLAVGQRLHRLEWRSSAEEVAARLHRASRSADPAARAAWQQVRAALAEPPTVLPAWDPMGALAVCSSPDVVAETP